MKDDKNFTRSGVTKRGEITYGCRGRLKRLKSDAAVREPEVVLGSAWSPNIRWSGKGYRFAVYLDLENLTREYWECEEWDGAIRALGFLLDDYSTRGAVLVRVAACNGRLAELLRPLIDDHNIETLIHSGGENAADNLLIRHLENHWPQECNVVVIGSGDSRFISVATRLKEDGKRPEGISPTGGTATDLYRLLDQHHQVPTPRRLILRRQRARGDHPLGLIYGGAVSSRIYSEVGPRLHSLVHDEDAQD